MSGSTDRRPRSSGGTTMALLPPCKAIEEGTLRALPSLLFVAMRGPDCCKARLSLLSTGMLAEPHNAMRSFV